MNRFIGREKELNGLKGLLKKRSASLVVIRGRRRIGKSRLAEEFAKSFKKSFLFTGAPLEKGVTAQDQRNEFARQMRRLRVPVTNPNDWGDLLTDLAEWCTRGRVLVVLDEITWMGGLDPMFLPKLKTIWDTNFKKNSHLILLISGSNSSWIESNILSSTGFMGRISYVLRLHELPLSQCNEFWGTNHHQIDPYEKFKVLAVTGGIPRYLEEIRPDLSAERNILQLCYQPTGILFREFDQIFSDLFADRNRIYRDLVLEIAKGRTTMKEILAGMKRTKGGNYSRYLFELEEAGFIRRSSAWNLATYSKERLGTYRIIDNYVRFYLKYILPNRERIQSGRFESLPRGWKSIMGLQFENLVINNDRALFRTLEIEPDEVVWSGSYFQNRTSRRDGCQIDYLIQTKHRILYLCEVKFAEAELPYAVIGDVERKSQRLAIPRGFSVRHVLIHVNGVVEHLQHNEFFSNIIDFGTLLNPG